MSEKVKLRCKATVHDSGGWHRYPCAKRASIRSDGNLWCGTHDPEKVKAKLAKREQAYVEKRAEEESIEASARELCNALGMGSPHYDGVIKRGYTGGITLRACEAKILIARLSR